MTSFSWKPKMSVGVPLIDEQHKKFFEMLNSLESHEGDVKPILDSLVQYMQFHFQTEEDFMKDRFFGEYPEHLAEHKCFSERVKNMMRDYRAGRNVKLEDIRGFMVEWLSVHIMSCDQKYARFIAKSKAALNQPPSQA